MTQKYASKSDYKSQIFYAHHSFQKITNIWRVISIRPKMIYEVLFWKNIRKPTKKQFCDKKDNKK